MEPRKRVYLAIVGGVFCATAGSLLGGLFVAVVRAMALRQEGLVVAAAFFPMAVLFASVIAVPFGLVVGSIGSWWLIGRVASGAPARRVYCESAGTGGLLGATFPLVTALGGWGPFKNLVSALPISIGAGIACGIVLAAFVRSYLHHNSLHVKGLEQKPESQNAS